MTPLSPRPQLRLLGGASLLDAAGAPVSGPAGQRHRIAVLAVLALARGEPVQREKLVGLLWPERDGFAARRLLRAALHALRQAVGPDALPAVGDELGLDPAHVAVDVHAFEDALAAGDHERAAALYAGPLLDGLFLDDAHEFDDWVALHRAELDGRYEAALEALAAEAEAAGGVVAAVTHWRTLAARRPSDGRVALRLMDALVAAGDRGAALAHADAHAAYLRAEFGVAPEASLRVRVAALRAPERPATEPTPPVPHPPAPRFPANPCGWPPARNSAKSSPCRLVMPLKCTSSHRMKNRYCSARRPISAWPCKAWNAPASALPWRTSWLNLPATAFW